MEFDCFLQEPCYKSFIFILIKTIQKKFIVSIPLLLLPSPLTIAFFLWAAHFISLIFSLIHFFIQLMLPFRPEFASFCWLWCIIRAAVLITYFSYSNFGFIYFYSQCSFAWVHSFYSFTLRFDLFYYFCFLYLMNSTITYLSSIDCLTLTPPFHFYNLNTVAGTFPVLL